MLLFNALIEEFVKKLVVFQVFKVNVEEILSLFRIKSNIATVKSWNLS